MIIIFYMKTGKKITATEAVRSFSEILNSVAFKGAKYTIVRGGKAIAELQPLQERREERTLGDLPLILSKLPRLGSEATAFDRDLRWVVSHQPLPATGESWE